MGSAVIPMPDDFRMADIEDKKDMEESLYNACPNFVGAVITFWCLMEQREI